MEQLAYPPCARDRRDDPPLVRAYGRSNMERMEHRHDTCEVCGLVPVAATSRRATRVIAASEPMRDLLRRVAKFARSDAPVVILGETGTGKEVVARTLHANSRRADGAFVAINVAALPADLLESELFGHARGAFTGAGSARDGLFREADGGTLFLDEIGEMPPALQAKLLRVLQDGEIRRVGEDQTHAVDVRVVCATHRDLAAQVRAGVFRQDLYYRLKVLTLEVPPLRARTADILPLALRFLADDAGTGFTDRARDRLLAHAWPGNVRELENAVRHGAALAGDGEIDDLHLPEDLGRPVALDNPLATLAAVERAHIERVLHACGGSQTEAARILGVARNTLWRKLRDYSPNQ
jgi:DNA-binding NtrC family response regulator